MELLATKPQDQPAKRSNERPALKPWESRREHLKDARRELAAEWQERGATASDDYRALTNTLFEHTFGMDVAAYRSLKGLPNDGSKVNLRDHMDEAELAITSLAESLAVFLLRKKRCRGMKAVLAATKDAGRIAGRTRFELERRLGHVSTPQDGRPSRIRAA